MISALPLAPRSHWIGGLDPRLRILSALLFALVTVSLTKLSTALVAFVLAAALAASLGTGLRVLLRRFLALEGFMLILLVTLPFTVSGEPLVTLGPLAASGSGVALAVEILLKANSIALVLLTLVGSLEPVVLGHALARLGVPEKLVHLLLMTVGQVHLLREEFVRLRQAMRARAFVPRSNRHTWNSYGWLLGMLLVRSAERSRRMMAAMRCRCFRGHFHLLDSIQWRRADTTWALGLGLPLAALAILDRLS